MPETTGHPLLSTILGRYDKLAVLYSGGADSEVLLRASAAEFGPGSLISLTADTPLLAEYYRDRVTRVSSSLGIEHRLVPVDPLSDPGIRDNGPLRCYHCKKLIARELASFARSRGFIAVADGTTFDDLSEERPGLVAAEEAGILHPLAEAGIGSEGIRELARRLGAGSTPPSDSCYATRISRSPITCEDLLIVSEMEEPLREHARGRIRVRYDGLKLVLSYTEKDRELVLSRLNELKRIAAEHGLTLETSDDTG